MMDEKSTENFKKLVADFRALTTKVQKDNQNKRKSLKETNLVLQACKKKYQKLYLEPKNLKKKKKYKEQQEELIKQRTHYRGGPITNKNLQDRKTILSDIEFDKEKLRNLLSAMQNRKPKERRYCNDIYFNDGVESDNKFSENEGKSSDEEIVKKQKILK